MKYIHLCIFHQRFLLFLFITFLLTAGCKNHKPDENFRSFRNYSLSIIDLQKMRFLVYESQVNTRKWIFSGKKEKAPFKGRLKKVHQKEFPGVISSINARKENWNPSERETYDMLLEDIKQLIALQDTVMSNLHCFDAYENPTIYFETIPFAEKVTTKSEEIITALDKIINKFEKRLDESG